MKKLKTTLLLSCLLLTGSHLSAQYDITTRYYDDFSGTLYSNESGDQGVIDHYDNLYVGGVVNRDGTDSQIHLIKYLANRNLYTQLNVNYSLNHKESVVKMLWNNTNQLYVIVKAVHAVPAATALVIYRYSATLGLINLVPFTLAGFSPEKACIDASGNIYVAGNTTNSISSVMRVYKLNAALVQQASYDYYYSSITDSVNEQPKDMLFDTWDNSVYLTGMATHTGNSKTASFLLKLASSNLTKLWKTSSSLSDNLTSFNSVASYNGKIYVTGTATASKAWRMSQYDATQGYWIKNKDYSVSGFRTEGLKITVASSYGIYAVGYSKSDSLNQYKIIIRKWASGTLSGPVNYYSETMNGSSRIFDAISKPAGGAKYSTFITGTRYVGGIHANYNMFLLQVDSFGLGGANTFRDSIVNHGAGGNKLVSRSGGYNNVVSVIGYEDNTSSNFTPHDYKIMTRTYSVQIQRLSDEDGTASEFKIYPNPATDQVTLSGNDGIKSYKLFDMQGRIIKQEEIAEEIFSLQLDINQLPPGMYFVSINNGKVRKLIKN